MQNEILAGVTLFIDCSNFMIEKRNYAGLSLDPVPTKYVLLYVLTRRYDCSLGYYL